MAIIEARNLSKRYHLGATVSHNTLRDSIAYAARSLVSPRKAASGGRIEKDSIWAIRDLSFDVEEGEVLGIIGRNGSGKSTLLKVLSRITEPTEGEVGIKGRVASLLEVGTGFHPELTGRENIFLNGAILGMRKDEIKRKFDEMVAFAEVEKFLDTPVKRYSSGMYVRLAFAVAAHMEPEIMVVDEVLAVGDAAFQRKCVGKMDDVAKSGRTVLFVSHNMAVIQKLCGRAILLNNGAIQMDDATDKVIDAYVESFREKQTESENLVDLPRTQKEFGRKLLVSKGYLVNSEGGKSKTLKIRESFSIHIEAIAKEKLNNISFIVGIDTVTGTKIVTVGSEESDILYQLEKDEKICLNVKFSDLFLKKGIYSVRLGARIGVEALDLLVSAFTIEVQSILHEDSQHNYRDFMGIIYSKPEWDKESNVN